MSTAPANRCYAEPITVAVPRFKNLSVAKFVAAKAGPDDPRHTGTNTFEPENRGGYHPALQAERIVEQQQQFA